jgi:hypothetical protein
MTCIESSRKPGNNGVQEGAFCKLAGEVASNLTPPHTSSWRVLARLIQRPFGGFFWNDEFRLQKRYQRKLIAKQG